MKVPMLDLGRQYEAIRGEIDAAIAEVLLSARFILGPTVRAFEEEAAAYCGAAHAITTASGTDALLLSLKALGVGPGDLVLLPSFTFFATAGAVCNVGATPAFCDVDPGTLNLDPQSLREALDDRGVAEAARAVIPVHLYGQMAAMDEIQRIADEHDLAVIEDAAQAISATRQDRAAGTLGTLGCFSFYPTKNLGAYGDGGMITTGDDRLATRVRRLRVHGAHPKYVHHEVGVNSRLDALQAAILRVKLAHLDDWVAARRRLADAYDERLRGTEGLALPLRDKDGTHAFHQYTVRVSNGRRDAVRKRLADQGIDTMVYYPVPLHLQPCFAGLGYRDGDLPTSERASQEVLSLPLFPELGLDELENVAAALRKAVSLSQP